MWRFQTGNRIELERGLYCIETLFGFFVSGTARSSDNFKSLVNLCVLGKSEIEKDRNTESLIKKGEDKNLNLELKKLWELDNLLISNEGESSLLNSEVEVLRNFENNLKYDNERYETGLPFKGEVDLPDNFEVSKRRLNSLVSRFRRDPVLYENYKSVFEEQLMSGVIDQVDIAKDDLVDRIYYAPHHPVIREQKESNRTRLRIVFDMSSKERWSLSLNDNLHSGPNLNPNLLTLLLKFRMNGIGIVADIERAFLSIGLKEVDRNCQRFLWIDKIPPTEIKVYRNTTVSFGVKSSPFHLAATIKHHVRTFENSKKAAYKALNDCLYVDDLIISLNDINEAVETCRDAKNILASANMNLREWRANSPELTTIWQNNNFEKKPEDNLIAIKVLGIVWNTVTDELKYDLTSILRALEMDKYTKRSILQMFCKLIDPMGLIAAFTITSKILLQETWRKF
ncbi:hypothetical protein JTE90_003838 [Oedothorax gibbosus]|uniref:Reverse transcriptase domain-containing protein n=1 Tax=Oedothorax gibbosus TaxID=931172 RepID=A0AAV6TYS7_9ARAC|nr:hypothetical protein JTE90_003838 [Oedothorax gibbosus]